MSARANSTTSSLSKKLTYTMARRFQNGSYQHFFTARCAKCNRTEEVAWSAGSEPDRIAKKMQEMGWSYDAFKSRACICPACKSRPRSIEHGPIEIVDLPPKRGRPRPLHVVEEIKARIAAGNISKCAATTKKEEPAVAQVLTMTTPPPLTIAAKARVRKLLDENFDDEQGRYIDNYSDQRIGEEVGVPWAAVAAMREAAYGPLRADPRIDQLRKELLNLKTQIDRVSNNTATQIDDLAKRIAAAEKTLTDINTGS